MKKVLYTLLLLALLGHAARADDTTTVETGVWGETKTQRFDYNWYYAIIDTQLGSQPFRLELDQFDNPTNSYRLWTTYGHYQLVRGPVEISVAPSAIFSNSDGNVGGMVMHVDVPKWGLNVAHEEFVGTGQMRFLTYTYLRLGNEIGLYHYMFNQPGYTPDSYVGPSLTRGNTWAWIGFSTTRPGAVVYNLQYSLSLGH